MKISPVASSMVRRKSPESGSWALVTHANADHAHQTSASASIARPSPAQDRSALERRHARHGEHKNEVLQDLDRSRTALEVQSLGQRLAGAGASPVSSC